LASSIKDSCGDFQPIWIIQTNIPIPRCLNQSHLQGLVGG
jgi:hypothetical protein